MQHTITEDNNTSQGGPTEFDPREFLPSCQNPSKFMMAATTTETAFQMMVSGSRGPRGTLEGKFDMVCHSQYGDLNMTYTIIRLIIYLREYLYLASS